MRLSAIFKYLKSTGRIELFDYFGMKPNPHLRFEFIEDCCGYSEASIRLYYTPTDYCMSSLADLLANQSFCRAWWGEQGLGWWSSSHVSFQMLRDHGLKPVFEYMWHTRLLPEDIKDKGAADRRGNSRKNKVAIRVKNNILKTVA